MDFELALLLLKFVRGFVKSDAGKEVLDEIIDPFEDIADREGYSLLKKSCTVIRKIGKIPDGDD